MSNKDQIIIFLENLKTKLIEEQDRLVEEYKEKIDSIQLQVNELNKETYIASWIDFLDITFKTPKAERDFNLWCRSHLTVDDITIFNGSYEGKYTKINICTCGYLQNKLLYQYDENFSEFINLERYETKPESLFPKTIKSVNQLYRTFLKLRKIRKQSSENIEDFGDEDNDLIDFIMIYGFCEYIKNFRGEEIQPCRRVDFSKYDY